MLRSQTMQALRWTILLTAWALLLTGCPDWFEDDPVSDAGIDAGHDGGQDAGDESGDGDTGIDGGDAQTDWDDLAGFLESYRSQANMPALAAAVLRGDELIALGVVGKRVDQGAIAASVSDHFHLGSCTKAMTATLLGTLVTDGLLDWDTTLAEAFPALEATMDPAYKPVTLAQLLAHRGGTWTALTDHPSEWNTLWTDPRPLPELRAWLTEQVLSQPPELSPDTTFAYSNTAYIIVGAAMELATGQAWEALMQQRIFDPLGMDSCGFGPPASPGVQDQPWGHRDNNGTWQPVDPGSSGADNPPALGPAGTVYCKLTDWGCFAAAHVLGENGDESFLPQATWQRLHTAWPGQEYGLGWAVVTRPWAGGTALSHAGSNTMWFATIWLAPARNTAMLAVTNCDSDAVRQQIDAIFGGLIPIYLP